ncbi:MAG: hypothetical protein ACRED1_07525 [Limisphaerales bacterium]
MNRLKSNRYPRQSKTGSSSSDLLEVNGQFNPIRRTDQNLKPGVVAKFGGAADF